MFTAELVHSVNRAYFPGGTRSQHLRRCGVALAAHGGETRVANLVKAGKDYAKARGH